MRVLGLLDGTEPRSVTDVQTLLRQQGTELAYTTVMTVLARLHDKGLVSRQRDARRYVYITAPGAGQAKHGILARVRKGLFGGNRLRPIVALLDDEELTQEDLEALQGLLAARLEDKRR